MVRDEDGQRARPDGCQLDREARQNGALRSTLASKCRVVDPFRKVDGKYVPDGKTHRHREQKPGQGERDHSESRRLINSADSYPKNEDVQGENGQLRQVLRQSYLAEGNR